MLSQWTKVIQRPVRATDSSEPEPEPLPPLQLPTAIGPLRRALQAPQHWPAAAAEDDVLLPTDGEDVTYEGAVPAYAGPAGESNCSITRLPDPSRAASPPLSLSPRLSVDSASWGSFTTGSGPCTPPGARRLIPVCQTPASLAAADLNLP